MVCYIIKSPNDFDGYMGVADIYYILCTKDKIKCRKQICLVNYF